MLPDPHAPLVTVSIEEPALAPAAPLARLPYWEHLLGLVREGLAEAAYSAAIGPALASAHADLTTYLAAVVVSLFDSTRLQALPEALAGFRHLADPTMVARSLVAQLRYVTDVAENMPR